jgi:glycosyltransferase involved in cell wall biosynthesis
MKIGLIVTARDALEDVKRFFLCVARQQTSSQLQIIFVNQTREDPLSDIQLPVFVQVKQLASEPCGLSDARNKGLRLLDDDVDVVAFPDDDCWYDDTLIASVVSYFENNRDVDCICTNVYDPDRAMSYGGRPTDLVCPITDFNLFRLPISVGIFVRRAALRRVGEYFDTHLGAGTPIGSGEETELVARVVGASLKAIYCGTIRVFHPVPVYVADDVMKYYRYGLGFGYLNGCLLRKTRWRVLPYFFNVLARSYLGFALHVANSVKRRLYWGRAKGILAGAIMGLRGKA